MTRSNDLGLDAIPPPTVSKSRCSVGRRCTGWKIDGEIDFLDRRYYVFFHNFAVLKLR